MTNAELKEIIENKGLEYTICEKINLGELDDVETYRLVSNMVAAVKELELHLELY
jgi:hypothetical protein